MKSGMKERIIGGVILVALAIIVLPMFFGGSGKKGGSQAPDMTINQQPINVPDQDVSNPQAGSDNQAGSNSDSSVSQYNQLLPGSQNPSSIHPNAAAAADQAQNGATPAEQGGGNNNAATSQPQSETNSGTTQTTTPAPAPQVAQAHHSEPAHTQPAPQHHTQPAPQHHSQPTQPASKPAAQPHHAAPAPSHASKPASSQQKGAMSSGDPIMAAANQYGSKSNSSAARHAAAPAGASASGHWSVQAGSFSQQDNATRLIKRLRGLGFEAHQISRGANKVVLVGPYASSSAGESARTQLQQKANINGFVVHSGGNAG